MTKASPLFPPALAPAAGAALLAAALALPACDDDGSGASDAAASLQAQLDARAFLLASSEGFEPVADTTVRLSFDGDMLAFHAGCNHHSGMYQVRDGRLFLENLGSTQIGCETALHEQDDRLATFFGSRPTVRLDGEELTFVGEATTLVFLDREVADPDRPLADTPWTVDTFLDGGAASSLSVDPAPALLFQADGAFEANSGCNTSGGHYTVRDAEITLSDVAFTERGCTGAAGAAETLFQAVIRDGAVTFEIEAARLTLLRDDVGLSATAP
jgi:heat shock protein HslJ